MAPVEILDSLSVREAINAVVVQEVMKADPDPADVMGGIGCRSQADKRIHLADEASGAACRSEADLAVPHPRLEVIEEEQGLRIDVDIDMPVTFSVPAGRYLNARQKMMKFLRPFNDGVLCERHG
jgi:hypothetical protein